MSSPSWCTKTERLGEHQLHEHHHPRNVVLQDQDGNPYSLRDAIWFGATFNANTGGFQATSTDKFQIASQGGDGG